MAKFWEFLKKIEEAPPEVQEQIVTPGTPGTTAAARTLLDLTNLRLGMWVSTTEGVGIVTGISADLGYVEVMLVDDAGENKAPRKFVVGSVQQAKFLQIPKARRPDTAHSGY